MFGALSNISNWFRDLLGTQRQNTRTGDDPERSALLSSRKRKTDSSNDQQENEVLSKRVRRSMEDDFWPASVIENKYYKSRSLLSLADPRKSVYAVRNSDTKVEDPFASINSLGNVLTTSKSGLPPISKTSSSKRKSTNNGQRSTNVPQGKSPRGSILRKSYPSVVRTRSDDTSLSNQQSLLKTSDMLSANRTTFWRQYPSVVSSGSGKLADIIKDYSGSEIQFEERSCVKLDGARSTGKTRASSRKSPLTTSPIMNKRMSSKRPQKKSFDGSYLDITGEPQLESTRMQPIVVDSESDDSGEIQVIEEASIEPNKEYLEFSSKVSKSQLMQPDFLKSNVAKNRYSEMIDKAIRGKNAAREHLSEYTSFMYGRIQQQIKCLQLEPPVMRVSFPKPKEEPSYPLLTEEIEAEVAKLFARCSNPDEVIIQAFAIPIKKKDIHTLIGLNWLNDEIINFYLNLIMDRSKQDSDLPKVHVMNTFFYPRLTQQGYKSVSRWTRRVDIFAQDIVFVPVHLSVHWCMACIDLTNKEITYYDSMGSPNNDCLRALADYVCQERLDKKKEQYSIEDWTICNATNIPQQNNASDCGVFALTFAEHISRSAPFTFSQKLMPYFRKKMAYEIANKKILC